MFCYFYLCTSAGPDPNCWQSGSSDRWWRPAHPSAAALDLAPPDSGHSLHWRRQCVTFNKTKQRISLVCTAPHSPHPGNCTQWDFWFICCSPTHKGSFRSDSKTHRTGQCKSLEQFGSIDYICALFKDYWSLNHSRVSPRWCHCLLR